MWLLCSLKPEILTLGHKRVPFDSHYPPEQKKTVEEVEETGAEAMQRDGSTHVHAGHVRYQGLPTLTNAHVYTLEWGSLGTWIMFTYR